MAKDEQASDKPARPQVDTELALTLKAIEEEKTPERILELARKLERLTRDT